MAGGFIKLHRQILNWEWYLDTNTFRLFIHLLLKANYENSSFQGRIIRRGQLVTSLTGLAAGTALTVRQVRDSLDKLKMTGEVTCSSTSRYTVITVVKYDDYQSSDTQNGTQMTRQTADKWQTDDTQNDTPSGTQTSRETATSKEYKNIKKERNKEKKKDNSLSGETGFEVFYSAYPKKVAKPDALKAWLKLKPDDDLFREIITGLYKWIASDQWQRDDGRYIPYPATWLNHQRWEDDVPCHSPLEIRQPVKQVLAQQYSQRDYSGVQDEIYDDIAREIDDMRKGGGA